MRWTEEQTILALQLIAENAGDAECMALVGRSYLACYAKMDRIRFGARNLRITSRVDPRPDSIPETLLVEAAKRAKAPRDLTAVLMGDPPKGYSALERRA